MSEGESQSGGGELYRAVSRWSRRCPGVIGETIQRFFEEEEIARLIHRVILKGSVDEVEQGGF